MKFQEFFEKNYKLIKLNFVLLGTLIFFLVLQLGQQSYAVTDEELSSMGLTTAEWADEVLKHNNISQDTGYIVWRCYDNDKSAVHTYLYTFPEINKESILLFTFGSSRFCINFTDNNDLTTISKSDFLLSSTSDGVSRFEYDYDLSGFSVKKNYINAINAGTCTFNRGLDNEFTIDCGIRMGNYAVSEYSKAIEYIQYTNFKYHMRRSTEILEFSSDKMLQLYDYEKYLIYDSNEFGNYIAIDPSITETNVDHIVFGGNNLMNGINDYILDVSINLETFKLYVNDSPDVDITFYDMSDKILYETLKFYGYHVEDLENFDYGSSVIYDSDNEGDYITLDNKLKGTDVEKIIFEGKFLNISTNKFQCTTLTDFSILKLYSDYTDNVIITMYNADGIVWSNVSNVVKYLEGYRFLTFFEYHDTLATVNETLNKLYYGKARMNFDLITGLNTSFDIRTLSDEKFSYDFSYRFKYVYSDETTDADYSEWFSVYDMSKNERGYYYLDLVYSNVIGLFVELAINVTDLNINETITYSYSTYSFSLLKGAKDGLIYWFDGNKGHNALGVYNKFNHVASNDVIIYDSSGNQISGVTSGQDVGFDFGFGIDNILDGFTTVIDTIKNGFSTLVGSVNSVGTLFSTAFSWLPTPIPELIKVVFGAMVLFAIIRFIRG